MFMKYLVDANEIPNWCLCDTQMMYIKYTGTV